MNTKLVKKTLVISSIVLIAGAAVAFAHGGGYGRHFGGYGGHMMGYGGGRMMDDGPGHMMGWGGGPHMRGYGMGGGYGAGLSEEDTARIDAARERFFEQTASLRGQMDEKRLALSNEMVKDEPDSAKAAELQNELSKLESEFDQKALAHRLEMRKLLPEKARGQGFGYGRGNGYGGACWQ